MSPSLSSTCASCTVAAKVAVGLHGTTLGDTFVHTMLVSTAVRKPDTLTTEEETLTVAGTGEPSTFKGVQIDSKFLKMAYSATGKASGLGPIPPVGGINSDWWKLAYVRQYLGRVGLVPG